MGRPMEGIVAGHWERQLCYNPACATIRAVIIIDARLVGNSHRMQDAGCKMQDEERVLPSCVLPPESCMR